MLTTLIKWFKRLFRGAAPINIVPTQKDEQVTLPEVSESKEVKEVSWFTRANDLVSEFADIPQKISSSNLSAWRDNPNAFLRPEVMRVEYKGLMILADDWDDLEEKKQEIDDGYTYKFITVEKFNELYLEKDGTTKRLEIPEPPPTFDEEELLHNDIDLLKNKYIPKREESKNYEVKLGDWKPKSDNHDARINS